MPRLPMPPTNDEAYAKNTKEQYEALGRFVEAFESMVDEVRHICIECIYAIRGNSRDTKPNEKSWEEWFAIIDREKTITGIPFYHQSMTAKPLFDIMRALIAETVNAETSPFYAERQAYKELLARAETEYSTIMWRRNDLLHGTWFVGYVSDTDPDASEFIIRRYKTTADGLAREQQLPKNAKELLELASRCADTRSWIATIGFCLNDKQPLSVFFKKDTDWKVFLTEGGTGTTLPRK